MKKNLKNELILLVFGLFSIFYLKYIIDNRFFQKWNLNRLYDLLYNQKQLVFSVTDPNPIWWLLLRINESYHRFSQ